MSLDYRHVSIGSLNIPPSTINGVIPLKHPTASSPNAAMARFDGPRSPPGRQNTSHVPCKFFRAGACQAGNSCPFSHDPASTTDNICKYFAKGNCRFGPKCANIHVLPDGRRINYTKSLDSNTGHLNINGQVNTDHFHSPKSASALTNSYLRNSGGPPVFGHQSLSNYREDKFSIRQQGYVDLLIPTIDVGAYTPTLASFTADDDFSRHGHNTPLSSKLVHMMDGPSSASVENSSISWVVGQNPMTSPVPCNLSLDSFSDSLPPLETRSSETLKNLHYSVFGDEFRDKFSVREASQSVPMPEEYLGVRAMPTRSSKKISPQLGGLPAVDKDWEANFTFEEDYLPETLKDLMTPQEKARRGSRNADDEARLINGNGTTNNDVPSKFGSPSNASPSNASPSRWGSLFQRQQQKEEEDRSRISAFSHIGSPLRKSSLHLGVSPQTSRPITRPGFTNESTSYLSSPPRRSSTSIISQQLQRTRISQLESNNCESLTNPSQSYSNSALGLKNVITSNQKSNVPSIINARHTPFMKEEDDESLFTKEGNLREKRRSTGNFQLGTIGGALNTIYTR